MARINKDILQLSGAIIAIILLNLLLSQAFFRVDFTSEKRFTLSPLTRQTMGHLDGKLDVVVYLDGDFPAGFKQLQSAVKDMLNDMKAYSGGDLLFDFVNPSSGSPEQRESLDRELFKKGIEPMKVNVPKEGGMSQVLVYPAAILSYKGRQIAVNLLPARSGAIGQSNLNDAGENLEYALMSGIKKLVSGGRPLIGITEGHGELSDLELYDAMSALSDGYDVRRVDLGYVNFDGLDKMKLLIIAKPQQAFTEAEKYKIDYFVMHGGRIIWSIDNVSAELDSLRGNGTAVTLPRKLDLDDLLFNYGARVNYELIADMHCSAIPLRDDQGQMQLVPWLYYPVFDSRSDHPLVKNLGGIKGEFAGTVDTIAVKGIRKQVVLASSEYSRIALTPGRISLNMISQEADPSAFRDKMLPAALLLEGKFPSAFSGRPRPEGLQGSGNLPARSSFTKMIVIGDGDLFKNQVSARDGSPYPLGFDQYTQQQFANKAFLLNSVDYLTDDSGLIGLRNKEIKVRLLDRPRIREEKLFWQSLNMAFPLLLLIGAGVFQHFSRKRKFAHS